MSELPFIPELGVVPKAKFFNSENIAVFVLVIFWAIILSLLFSNEKNTKNKSQPDESDFPGDSNLMSESIRILGSGREVTR